MIGAREKDQCAALEERVDELKDRAIVSAKTDAEAGRRNYIASAIVHTLGAAKCEATFAIGES